MAKVTAQTVIFVINVTVSKKKMVNALSSVYQYTATAPLLIQMELLLLLLHRSCKLLKNKKSPFSDHIGNEIILLTLLQY